MYDEETGEHAIWYVAATWGGDFRPSEFNVTRLNESYVKQLIASIGLFSLKEIQEQDIMEMTVVDEMTYFVSQNHSWELQDGEEDPQDIFSKDRLCDLTEDGSAERLFLPHIPVSLEEALKNDALENVVPAVIQRRVICSDGVYWKATPKYHDDDIEVIALSLTDLMKVNDWLTTARQLKENS